LALPIAVITITGAILAFGWATNLLFLVTGSHFSAEPMHILATTQHRSRQDAKPFRPETFVDMQQILNGAERQAPGWRILRVAMPNPSDRTIAISIDFLDNGRSDQTAEMIVDRHTGAVLKLNRFSSYSLGTRLRLITRSIHTGSAGGLAGQTVAGLSSLFCCALVWTGLSMSMRRFRGSAMFAKRALRSESINLAAQTTPDGSAGSADRQLN
jgi:uncharacterized iron-regulated membrane protein